MTPQDQGEVEVVETLRKAVEGQKPQGVLPLRHSVQATSNVRKAWRRTQVANYLPHTRMRFLQMEEARLRGGPAVPYMPLEEVLGTPGDGPHKRRLPTQELISDQAVFPILCETSNNKKRS